tara:strand:+ start:206 stop:1213 length:1008 start_codon:yes stop_codon:yes gene_type:complete
MAQHNGYSIKRALVSHCTTNDTVNEIQFDARWSVKVKPGTSGNFKKFIVSGQVFPFDEIPTIKAQQEFKTAIVNEIETFLVSGVILSSQAVTVNITIPPSAEERSSGASIPTRNTSKSGKKSENEQFLEILKASSEAVSSIDFNELSESLKKNDAEQSIRDIWENEMKRKVDLVVDAAPWRNKEDMRAEGYSNCIKFAQEYGIVPHISNSAFRGPFLGNVDLLFADFVRHYDLNFFYYISGMGAIEGILKMYVECSKLSIDKSNMHYVDVVREYFEIVEGTLQKYKRKFIEDDDDDENDNELGKEEYNPDHPSTAISICSSDDDEPLSKRVKKNE